MTDNRVVWEEPGPAARQTGELWRERLRPLLDHPKRWARVGEYSRYSAWQVAAQLRRGIKLIPPGRWEFATRRRKDDPDRAYVYARYLGPEDGGT